MKTSAILLSGLKFKTYSGLSHLKESLVFFSNGLGAQILTTRGKLFEVHYIKGNRKHWTQIPLGAKHRCRFFIEGVKPEHLAMRLGEIARYTEHLNAEVDDDTRILATYYGLNTN
jgi:hypothetical protein